MDQSANFEQWRRRLRPENDDEISPDLLDDESAFALFLSQLTHPSTRQMDSHEIGGFIQDLLGAGHDEEWSSRQLAWQNRLMSLERDSDDLADEEFNELIEDGDGFDEPFATIVEALSTGRTSAQSMVEERRALLLLKDLRLGAVDRGLVDEVSNHKWLEIIDRLKPDDCCDEL